MPELYSIRIRKEALKFAAAHMTVFPDGTKEALHGHQYMPTVTVSMIENEFKEMIPFSEIKKGMTAIAKEWDEKILLATQNPYFKVIKKTKSSLDFTLCKKRYVLPVEEVVLLETQNITCEDLAKVYFERLYSKVRALKKAEIMGVSVDIEESPGQGATYHFHPEHLDSALHSEHDHE